MRHVTTVLSIVAAFAFFAATLAPPVAAQHEGHHGHGGDDEHEMREGMMGPGMQGMQQMHRMHQQMMQNPVQRSAMMTFMLPAFGDKLELSDEQMEELEQLRDRAMTQRGEHQERMMERREQLDGLFENGQPAPGEVRQHLMEMAELRADQQASMYAISQRMHEEVLTDEQRQMLADLSPRERMHHMMENMPMRDMMRSMRGAQSAMGGGMMRERQGPMMDGCPMMEEGGMEMHDDEDAENDDHH